MSGQAGPTEDDEQMSIDLSERRTLVSVMFEDASADGLVRLVEHGDEIEVAIKAKSKIDGVTRILGATLNQAMAGVLADELRHWLNGKDEQA